MKHRPARLLLLAAGPLCLLALAAPATAQAGHHAAASQEKPAATTALNAMAGYFVNSGPENLIYDSAGGTVSSTNPSTGSFRVLFAGLGGITGGHAEVTSTSTSTTCSVDSWGPVGSDLAVVVDCYDLTGSLSNGNFSLMVTQPRARPRGMLAYDRIGFPSKSYTPTGRYQYNSTGHRNRVKHLATGRYQVVMPVSRKNTGTGTVKVSAFGPGGGDCQLKSWGGIKGGIVSDVDCYAPGGARQDRKFDIAFARSNNLMGQNTLTDANAFAARPANSLYKPPIQYDSHPRARVSASELSVGEYLLLFVGSSGHRANPDGGGGNVQVSTVSGSYVHCAINQWVNSVTPFAIVECASNSGHPVSARFDIQFATR